MPSSPIRAVLDQLQSLELEEVPSPQQVLAALGSVPDPRHRRGIRHPVEGLLVIAICAVASGARSFTAMAEWAADTAASALAGLGIGAPHAATIGRVLSRMDAEALDAMVARWAQARREPAVIAVDGKEIRGAKNGGGTTVRLLSALEHDTSVVLAQAEVGAKTNEIPMFSVLRFSHRDATVEQGREPAAGTRWHGVGPSSRMGSRPRHLSATRTLRVHPLCHL